MQQRVCRKCSTGFSYPFFAGTNESTLAVSPYSSSPDTGTYVCSPTHRSPPHPWQIPSDQTWPVAPQRIVETNILNIGEDCSSGLDYSVVQNKPRMDPNGPIHPQRKHVSTQMTMSGYSRHRLVSFVLFSLFVCLFAPPAGGVNV